MGVALDLRRAAPSQYDLCRLDASRGEDKNDRSVERRQASDGLLVQPGTSETIMRAPALGPDDLGVVAEPFTVDQGEHV